MSAGQVVRKRASHNVPAAPELGGNVVCSVSSWRLELARSGWAGAGGGVGEQWEQVVLSQAPRPSAPDTAAVLETGPGGQREERSGGCVLFCRERNELSLKGPTHPSAGRHAASCVTGPAEPLLLHQPSGCAAPSVAPGEPAGSEPPGLPNPQAAAIAVIIASL